MAEKRYLARIYRARPRKQKRTFQGKLIGCTETSAAVFFDAVTCGGVSVSEDIVRAMSSEPNPNPASPGLNIPQIAAVAKKLHIHYVDKTGQDYDDVRRYLDEGRRIHAQLEYRFIGGNDVPHAIEIEARRQDQEGIEGWAMLINDPMKGRSEWVREPDVLHGMKALAVASGMPQGLRFATGKIVRKLAAGA